MDPGVSGPRPGAGSMAMPGESGPQSSPCQFHGLMRSVPALLHQLDYRGV